METSSHGREVLGKIGVACLVAVGSVLIRAGLDYAENRSGWDLSVVRDAVDAVMDSKSRPS